jgi:hypothetical protein
MARTLALIFRLAQAPHRFRRALRPSYGPMLGDIACDPSNAELDCGGKA